VAEPDDHALVPASASRSGSKAIEPQPPTRIYRFLRSLARAALGLFYRHVEVTGLEHVDPEAPTILAPNHPNSIVDPLLVGLFEPRQVVFCARDGLFKVPVLGLLLRAIGAVAIRRRSDHAGAVDNLGNDQAFAECRAVLARAGVLSIFPEGKTHDRLRVEPIKTGVARIAIDAVRERPDLDLRIIPVGLNYLVREAFRSDVHVAFGPAIHVGAELEALVRAQPDLADDPRGLVMALTERLELALRELAIHVEEREDERLIAEVTTVVIGIRDADGIDSQGQSPAERTALVRRILDAYHWLEDADPIRCARLRIQLMHYLDQRRALGIGGSETALQQRRERRYGREDHTLFGPIGLVLTAPLAALGVAAAALPYALVRALLLLMRPRSYRIALVKLLGGGLLFFAWFALLVWTAFTTVGPMFALGLGLALVPLAVFAHRYVIDLRLYRFGLRTNLRRIVHRRRFSVLELRRRWLVREIASLRAAYLHARSLAASEAP
jgi:glycerol-3-phosphate O-acyltransferase / dihydroxyacetone phosphate acyltransferase